VNDVLAFPITQSSQVAPFWIFGTRMQQTCSRQAFIQRSPASVWGIGKVGVTLDLYSHVLPGMQAEAAMLVDALISGALLQRQKNAGR
jgi:hypothetical protein